jgi:hypothetical protein
MTFLSGSKPGSKIEHETKIKAPTSQPMVHAKSIDDWQRDHQPLRISAYGQARKHNI